MMSLDKLEVGDERRAPEPSIRYDTKTSIPTRSYGIFNIYDMIYTLAERTHLELSVREALTSQ